jgi:hypothetical protein
MSPAKLGHGLVELAHSDGPWSWFWWLVEAAVVFSMVVYLMHEVDIEVPFCETCHAWTKVVVSFERLLAGDAAALVTMRPRLRGEDEYGVVRVYRCKCGNSRYVSLDRASERLAKAPAWVRIAGSAAAHRCTSIWGRARPRI